MDTTALVTFFSADCFSSSIIRHESEENRKTFDVVEQLLEIFEHLERGTGAPLRLRDLPLVATDLVEERQSLLERLATLETKYLEARAAKESAIRR